MTDVDTEWLTIPDLVERLGLTPGRIHRLLEERILLGTRRTGPLTVPSAFLDGSAPRTELRGTVTVLHDAGFGDDEAIDWLLSTEDSLGIAPIDALRAGRKAEVRRIAQAL